MNVLRISEFPHIFENHFPHIFNTFSILNLRKSKP